MLGTDLVSLKIHRRAGEVRHSWLRVVALISLGLCLFNGAVNAQTIGSKNDSKDQRLMQRAALAKAGVLPVIIKLKRQTSDDDMGQAREALRASLQKVFPQSKQGVETALAEPSSYDRVFKYVPMQARSVTPQQLTNLLADPTLDVFEDSLKRPSLAQSVPRVYPTQSSSSFHGNNQWAVAVLDTGINKNHPFLSNKVVSEACYSNGGSQPSASSLCPGGVVSSTAVNSGLNCDLAGCEHGTQVAGVAVGNGPSFDGVARDGRLISIQVYSQINDDSFCFPDASCIGAFTSDIILALERVYELRNSLSIASVNLSLGSDELFSGSCDEQPERPIIDLLTAAGIAVVAATGNNGNTSQMQSPACITNAIAVAATLDSSDTAYLGNNISNQLDLFAPGINITTSDSNGNFSTATGTSMAAPHVAGAWAVLKHASPGVSVADAQNLFKAAGPLITQNTVSRRRLNLSAVLQDLMPGPTPDVPGLPTGDAVIAPLLLLLLGDE